MDEKITTSLTIINMQLTNLFASISFRTIDYENQLNLHHF